MSMISLIIYQPRSNKQQRPSSVLSNAQLVDIFAEKLNLTPERKKSLIGNICFCDSMSEDGPSGVWSPKDDYVRGGRLGRNHTLPDVPNHFIRDWMLGQIDKGENEVEDLNEDQREASRRAILPDLTADEVKEYSRILTKRREDEERAERAEMGIPEADATPDEIRRCHLKRIMNHHGFEHERQAEVVLRLEEALKDVDTAVDLTPRVRPGVLRNYEKYGPLRRSVIVPYEPRLVIDAQSDTPTQIDRDCDQVRLMIRRFCLDEEEWPRVYHSHYDFDDLEAFRATLQITRQSLTAFLKKKGPENGDRSQAYELAWEFFKRRDLVGYPLVKDEKRARIIAARKAGTLNVDDGDIDEAIKEAHVVQADGSEGRLPKRKIRDQEDHSEGSSKKAKTTAITGRRSQRLRR